MENVIKNMLIFIVITLLSFNCSENSTNPDDNLLNEQLIGNWNSEDNYSITFFNNGTFIDTIYFEDIKDTSYPNYGMFVRKGEYKIDNSILSLTDFYFDEIITQASIGLHMVQISYDIKIESNELKMHPVNIFEPQNNNTQQLDGSWQLKGYYCVYSQEIEPKTSFGETIENYNFYSDSSKYLYSKKYLSGVYTSPNPYVYLGDYIYNKPYLDLPVKADYHVLVKFIGNKMYWYYNYEKALIKK